MARALDLMSRVIVLISALAAVAMEAWIGGRTWAPLPYWTAGLLVVGIVTGRRWPIAAWWPVAVLAYIVPAFFRSAIGGYDHAFLAPWLAWLLGVVLGTRRPLGWALPRIWAPALAFWGLVVALSWPVVVAREADFRWFMMSYSDIGNSNLGGPPPLVAVLVGVVALTHLSGILFFDHLFALHAVFGERAFATLRRGLAVSLALCASIGMVQGLVDINWLSDHQWPSQQRAAGGLLDGDASGALCGFWASASMALGGPVGPVLFLMAWGGLWFSGSRMALLAGLIGVVFLIGAGMRVRRWRLAIGASTAVALVAVTLVSIGALESNTASPLTRSLHSLPELTVPSLEKFAKSELFDRFGPFGTASVLMVRQFPVTGVGVGAFAEMFPDYARMLVGNSSHFDNAQSWYRHHFAELGVLGMAGWLWWCGTFAWFLFRYSAPPEHRFERTAVVGALAGVALVSLVSMPTQILAVSLTVWVFVYWIISTTPAMRDRLQSAAVAKPAIVWTLVFAGSIAHAATTYAVARKDLRPPFRAEWADWIYEWGWYEKETGPDGPFRWMQKDAVDVVPIRGRYLRMTVKATHPDIQQRPVVLRVWRRDELLGDLTLRDDSPTTWFIEAPDDLSRMMLTLNVDRDWSPADHGSADARRLALAVNSWSFVDQPPPGAVVKPLDPHRTPPVLRKDGGK